MKSIVFTCQLVFHYLLISLLIFLWFNFQLSDAIHGKFVFLDKQVDQMNYSPLHEEFSFSHISVFIGDSIQL